MFVKYSRLRCSPWLSTDSETDMYCKGLGPAWEKLGVAGGAPRAISGVESWSLGCRWFLAQRSFLTFSTGSSMDSSSSSSKDVAGLDNSDDEGDVGSVVRLFCSPSVNSGAALGSGVDSGRSSVRSAGDSAGSASAGGSSKDPGSPSDR